MIKICPSCGEKENLTRSGIRRIELKDGTIEPLQMYKCGACLYRFSQKTMEKYLGDSQGITQAPVEAIPEPAPATLEIADLLTPKSKETAIRRALKDKLTTNEYLSKHLEFWLNFDHHKKKT